MSAPPTPLPPASAAAPDRPRALATMARNAAIFALGEGALKVLTALLAPWFTVLLTPYAFGVWGLGAMVQNLLLPVLGLGLHGAMTRLHFDSADAAERRRLQGTLVTFQLLWGAAVCALLLATAPWWQPLLLPGLGLWPTLTLVVAGALLSQIAALPVATWTAEERAGTIVGWRTASSLAYLAAAIALVAGLEAGVDGVFAARLLGALVLVAPVLAWLRRLPWGIDGPTLRPALAFGLPLVPHLLAHWALAMADRGMIEHMLGTAAVGIYSAAYIVPDTVQLVSVAVNGAYVPVANRWIDSREGGAVLTRAATGFAAVVVVAALAAANLAPPVLRWVLNDRYAAAALWSRQSASA